MREASITRKTRETDIALRLCLDGGEVCVETGCGFLDHMLTLFASHGRMGLDLRCVGDLHVDAHHVTEDIGLALGTALARALGDKRGVCRYGSVLLPMDEALVRVALDLSGRCGVYGSLPCPSPRVGEFEAELGMEFLWGLARGAGLTLHVEKLAGENTHHILEALFKGLGRALREAVRLDPDAPNAIPSTKGVL